MLIDLHNDSQMFLLLGILSIGFVIYFLSYFLLNWKNISFKSIFLLCLAIHLPFLLIPFISSNDLYSYIFTTRVNSLFGANPYFVQYDSFQHDVLYKNLETIWAHHPTLYGPLFLQIGGLINLIGQNDLGFLTLAFKGMFIAANLGCIYLIYKISRSVKAMFLYGANPLVVFELSGNSHTESLTLLLLLLSIYFLFKKPFGGFLAFIASTLIKYYTALFLPFYLVKLKAEGKKKLFLSILVGGLMIIAAFWPFWRGPENFDYLLSYYNGQYISPSLLIYVGELLFGSYRLSFQINSIIFLSVTLLLIYKFWKSKGEIKHFIFYSYLLYLIYILTKSSLILPWYLILLVSLACLLTSFKEYRKQAHAGLFFVAIYSLGMYFVVR